MHVPRHFHVWISLLKNGPANVHTQNACMGLVSTTRALPVHPFRNHHLEPCTPPRLAVFTDGDAGDSKDFAGDG